MSKEMLGGCCVCSDERGWDENPLVYCDGAGCYVAVHQACYGIVTVPSGPWYCRKCESHERSARVKCDLCPSKDGALKRTDLGGWCHVICALYIPEVRFGNVTTMEPIQTSLIPQDRYNKICYICEINGKSKANFGACMQCNKPYCNKSFHVTCGQMRGLLCEEAGNLMDNVKYCGYCDHHYSKLKKTSNLKIIPPFKPVKDSREGNEKLQQMQQQENKISPDINFHGSSSSSSSTTTSIAAAKMLSFTQSLDLVPNSTVSQSDAPPTSTTNTTTTTVDSSPPLAQAKLQIKPPPDIKPHVTLTPIINRRVSNENEASSKPIYGNPPVLQKPISPDIVTSDNYKPPDLAVQGNEKEAKIKRQRLSSEIGESVPKELPFSMKDSKNKLKRGPGRPSKRFVTNGTEEVPKPKEKKALFSTSSNNEFKNSPTKVEVLPAAQQDAAHPHAHHMFGNVLNPTSSMAQRMVDTLSQEMESIAAATSTTNTTSPTTNVGNDSEGVQKSNEGLENEIDSVPLALVPFPLPGKSSKTPSNTSSGVAPPTLEQLLERQWEQGSQFLMEQAQHLDIAQLLSCLNQLKSDNKALEEHVQQLNQRKDQLIAINARLSIPINNNIININSISVQGNSSLLLSSQPSNNLNNNMN